jgi:hypothetical protein
MSIEVAIVNGYLGRKYNIRTPLIAVKAEDKSLTSPRRVSDSTLKRVQSDW